MKRLDFEKMMEREYNLKPDHYIVELTDGTILKTDEEMGEDQTIFFNEQTHKVVHLGNPLKVNSLYQGTVKECYKLNFVWDANTDVNDIYYSLIGNPIPVSLLALLVKHMLMSI